jgi:ataxia telangiectasia mutated family protein
MAYADARTDDFLYAAVYSHLATPVDICNLLRACCGEPVLNIVDTTRVFWGSIGQFRRAQEELRPILRYLLLLEDNETGAIDKLEHTCLAQDDVDRFPDPTRSHAAKRLVLELVFPKMEQLLQLSESWSKKGEGATQVSADKLQTVILGSLSCIILLDQFSEVDTTMARDIGPLVFNVVDLATKAILDSENNDGYFDLLLTSVAPYLPAFSTSDLRTLKDGHKHLLELFAKVSGFLQERSRRELSDQAVDLMDVDDEFPESQASSQKSSVFNNPGLPRRDVGLSETPQAFYVEVKLRLRLLAIIYEDDGQLGLVPAPFLDDLLALPTEQLLCCRRFIRELLSSDLITALDDATSIIEALGLIISSKDFSYCEAALCLILEVMEALMSLWIDDQLEIASMVGDLYNHFVKYALPKNELSPRAQASLSKVLFGLLAIRSDYAASLKLPSCRSTLFSMLRDGSMRVKYAIGTNAPKIFSMFVLKSHDEIFVDILDNLPSDPKATEGIAFRLHVLAELACNWSTLLRRSVYHIFETPARIPASARYATSCIQRISQSLKLEAPRELFRLFAPQLLYTWLHDESLATIPFEIFGFRQLRDLLVQAQVEVAAILMMLGKDEEILELALRVGLTPEKLVEESFTKIMAYGLAHDSSHVNSSSSGEKTTVESRVRKILGKESYYECIHLNFADIVATFFDIFDQEDPLEKYLRKEPNGAFAYAADILEEIKELGCLDTVLPPNQQPMFRAKYLTRQLTMLCGRTEYELQTLWTPSLVVAVARRLLNTVHPAFGPLHACSVIRKIRVVISMAGSQALDSYPLEMLLHSTRMFLKDPECADDALGVARYLIQHGGHHLKEAPSFVAGYALSSLADLRVFLESSQSSTTQESQFKATISKAQVFHTWFATYLANYDSPAFKDNEQRRAFRAITQSAANIRASGNAEKGTAESNLLLEILKDEEREVQLLNQPAREVALDMLCGVFTMPQSSRTDVIETDEEALDHGAIVLKSCRSQKLSEGYLAWGGRVVGRSFVASGEIPLELLRESRLSEYRKLSSDNSGSDHGILNILEALTVSSDCITAGLAESALRTIVSEAYLREDQDLIVACQRTLSEALLVSSNWEHYRTPPSDYRDSGTVADKEALDVRLIESREWPQRLAIYLARSVPDIVLLRVLPPILANVPGCAERSFPFIIHLVLLSQLDRQQGMKRQLSDALREWLKLTSEAAKENQKLLINTLLYLRTQMLPNETSIVDRCHWLEVNFSTAAAAATRCGMFKTALLFTELASSEISRSSRRSSAIREAEDPIEILLDIFENIDDPDAYYGLAQDASLATVLARLEYENDGSKSLAFRGAQYDSHLRRRDPTAQQDGRQLIKALSSLGLAGLSHSLLQAQQDLVESPTSLDSTFTTARRLEVWNLPTPPDKDNYAVNLYKAYQTMHKSDDISVVRGAIHDGLKNTIGLLSSSNLTASNLRHHLGALAALTELDDLTNVTDPAELEAMLKSFSARSKWMMSGRYVT